MKILLIAGDEHKFISEYLSKDRKTIIVNKNSIILDAAAAYLREHPSPLDKIVVTDGGLSANPDDNVLGTEHLAEMENADIIVVTRDFLFDTSQASIRIIKTRYFRATENDFDAVFNSRLNSEVSISGTLFGKSKLAGERKPIARPAENTAKTRKWGSFKRKTEENDNQPSVSIASSKAILFTGHRGSGATSTAVNTAFSASRCGVNTILVDLDVDYRSTNLYFGKYYIQAEKDEYIASSLIRTLAQPQSYQTTAVNIERNLWLTTLGYDFNDKKLIEQHLTELKIIGLITALKHNFDLVAVDMPLDSLGRFPSLLNSIDVFSLCMENTIYSAITTLRNIAISFKESERIAYLASKSRLVVTKYNDESLYNEEIITPDRLSELIVSEGFSEDFETIMPVAGSIPYINWFGKQIENDIPIMDMDNRMQEAYDAILLRLLGAAR